jgi:NADPH:quinone reductase-like Zn-dependent oxidoreductase
VAVQLARQAGAEVIGTASPSSVDFVASLGADQVVGYADLIGNGVRGVDVVVDSRGGSDFISLLDVLRPGGTIVTLKGLQPSYEEALAARGVRAEYEKVAPDGEALGQIAELVEQERLQILVEHVFDLEQAAVAHAVGERGHVHGKLVLDTT